MEVYVNNIFFITLEKVSLKIKSKKASSYANRCWYTENDVTMSLRYYILKLFYF